MRLLTTSTFKFQEFFGDEIPHYAILSHTSGNEEISFENMQSIRRQDKTGFAKINDCCARAARDGWDYIWIDICCIDNTSSAELSEAINSMFDCYRKAVVCYAYLVDVSRTGVDGDNLLSTFRRSRWFTRGWTFQELLAPKHVIFYDCEWRDLGAKSSLSRVISEVTGITPSDMMDFKHANVAVKMSWASKRQTSRVEDLAYCLMGLFDVHMPLLYGEGQNAFLRLQLEIIKVSNDETIFAWDDYEDFNYLSFERMSGTRLLAPSPSKFRRSGDIRQVAFDADRPAYSMTNKGLRIELLLWRETDTERQGWPAKLRDIVLYLAPLNCTRHPKGHPLVIYVKESMQSTPFRGMAFTRVFPTDGGLRTIDMKFPGPNLKSEGRKIVNVKRPDFIRLNYPTSSLLRIKYPPLLCQIRQPRFLSVLDESDSFSVTITDRNAVWDESVPGEAMLSSFGAVSGVGVVLNSIINNRPGEFVVLVWGSCDECRVGVAIGHGSKPSEEIFAKRAIHQGAASDRISRHLRGGALVSAAVKCVGPLEKSKDAAHALDINIDAKSRHLWPSSNVHHEKAKATR